MFRICAAVVLIIVLTLATGCSSGGGDSIVSKFSDPIETNITFRGLITNGYGIPIKGASVDLSSGDQVINIKTVEPMTDAVSGQQYNFIYYNIPKGNYGVDISMSGYASTSDSIEVSNKDIILNKSIYEELATNLASISVYCTSTKGVSVSSAVLQHYNVVTSASTGVSTKQSISQPVDAVSGTQIVSNHFKFDNIIPSFKETVSSTTDTLIYEKFFQITVTWSDASTTVRDGIWAPDGITTLFNIIE